MTQVLSFRADEDDLRTLAGLRREGESTTDVIRRALRAAQLLDERAAMRAEAEALAADPADLAEAKAVQEAMAALRAW